MLHTWRKTLTHPVALSRDAVGYRCFAVLVVLLSLRSMTTCQSDKRGCRHQLLRRCSSMNRWAFGNRTAEQFDSTGSTGWLLATYWLHISYLLANCNWFEKMSDQRLPRHGGDIVTLEALRHTDAEVTANTRTHSLSEVRCWEDLGICGAGRHAMVP